ncbi:S9 family peptidase [Zymobacter palmae]|uniref:Protease II n=1 Tax=Zymobacter palmae TaxID=33074 RepID=A0A348HCS5_9GAMM|nr:prolyl oligopeptidase family serine peptidase [Zymobacter palmae]BBG29427.1 protease II [Zymobacter palmae]
MKAQSPSRPERPVDLFFQDHDPEWLWLESREDPQVRRFLEAANQEANAWFTPLTPLIERLYDQQLKRRELAVTSLSTTLSHHVYWHHTEAEAEYPIWYRHPIGQPEQRQTLLDLPTLARETGFAELGDLAISPDEQWLAWTLDTRGDEYYDLYMRPLPSGEPIKLAEGIGPELIWAEDNRHLLYSHYDATQRPASVWAMDTQQANAPFCLFEEDDTEFWVGLGKTRSRQWLMIETASKDTSETHLLPADLSSRTLTCVRPRETGIEYHLDHMPGVFLVLHNTTLPQGQLDLAPESAPAQWHAWLPAREDVTLDGVDAFEWGIVLTERYHADAQVRLRIIEGTPSATASTATFAVTHDALLPLEESPSSLMLEDIPHFNSRTLRIREESFTTPPRYIACDLDTGSRTLLKQQPVYGDLQPNDLVARRLWATAPDGVKVPVSVVMTKTAAATGAPLPTLLYGYGAYGEALDPWFSIPRLGLLERGVAFAVAHVRGGGDCGEPWYRAGKLEHKHNTFTDFIAARDALVNEGISDEQHVVAHGGSAGGLLVGASINLAPDAFCAAVLDVPFVDVLRTMQNPDLPLTTAEYTEWGNPEQPDVFERIKAYSPLDNVRDQPWPALFIQGSWHDSRVAYWEPAKLYARITQAGTARGPVLMRTEMDAGHSGASGRFEAWRDTARQDAFILWALQCADR